MQPVTTSQAGSGFFSPKQEKECSKVAVATPHRKRARDHKTLAAFQIDSTPKEALRYFAKPWLGYLPDSKQKGCEAINAYLSGDPVTHAIWKYVSTRDTSSLVPMVCNPPEWSEVLTSLRQLYVAVSLIPCRTVRLDTPLHKLITRRFMFMTQLPVKETIEATCQGIGYFRDNLQKIAAGTPMVVAGIASGNAIYERAIMEYFLNQQQTPCRRPINGLVQMADNLYIHCSDLLENETSYHSNPLMEVARMDYRKAVMHIARMLPEAAILPFASWIPNGEDGWFDELTANPAVIGFIHLRDKGVCGDCSSSHFTVRKKTSKRAGHAQLVPQDTEFWSKEFNVLGWGANDSLEETLCDKITLRTVLELKYPFDIFAIPKLPAKLLYDSELRRGAYCQLPLGRRQTTDSGSSSDSS